MNTVPINRSWTNIRDVEDYKPEARALDQVQWAGGGGALLVVFLFTIIFWNWTFYFVAFSKVGEGVWDFIQVDLFLIFIKYQLIPPPASVVSKSEKSHRPIVIQRASS